MIYLLINNVSLAGLALGAKEKGSFGPLKSIKY